MEREITLRNKLEIPIWEKSNLTIEEAAKYSGIGIIKLREMTERSDCPFVLWVGRKRLIKRREFDAGFCERGVSDGTRVPEIVGGKM